MEKKLTVALKPELLEPARLLVRSQAAAQTRLHAAAAELESARREKTVADLGVGAFVVAVTGLPQEKVEGRARIDADEGVVEVRIEDDPDGEPDVPQNGSGEE